MVKHYIIWKMKDEVENKSARANEIKLALEGLVGKIEGLVEMKILTEKFDCSSGDVMMDSTFKDFDSLSAYQKHPLRVEIASGLVRPSMVQRLSFDCEL